MRSTLMEKKQKFSRKSHFCELWIFYPECRNLKSELWKFEIWKWKHWCTESDESEGSSEKVLISRSSILIHKINWVFYTPHIVQRIEIFKSFEQLGLGVRIGVSGLGSGLRSGLGSGINGIRFSARDRII
jgi:hypothetical protein